jgi:hypothetical protein
MLPAKVKDIAGQVFGRAEVIQFDRMVGPRATWLCMCSCGNTFVATGTNLRTGATRSCGCLMVDVNRAKSKHGNARDSGHSGAYRSWRSMKQRCNDAGCNTYANYGGRGIRHCERWSIFENFFEDMGPRPDGYSLERLDCNGDYEPGNCTWIPLNEQAQNTRATVRVKLDGDLVHQAEAARRLSVRPAAIWAWRRYPWRMPKYLGGRLEFST